MKTPMHKYFHHLVAVVILLAVSAGQQSSAQSYVNINFTNSDNKYSLITDVKSITFDESGGIIVKKTDNSLTTETLTLIKSITLDATSGGGAPLPVELVSFTAGSVSGNIELKWKTAAEKNNYGFEIEKQLSNDNITKLQNSFWKKTGFVEGNGTTHTPNEYTFTERDISPGKYSYRLKQIDRDGRFEYSKEVEVTVAGIPKEFALEQNFPNPFNPTTEIRYQMSEVGKTALIIYDALGREAATLVNEVKEAGSYSASFDGTKLASGVYIARLTSNGKSQMRKLVLMK
jgi:hypothetical protein